ncbi:MAG: hypothetical protein MI863_27370 [Desulfobacterales bacterium]|nr:hypothetical protein [Desulfobacterales bacterium]
MTGYTRQFTEIIHRVLAGITPEQGMALHLWANKLLTLRTSTKSRTEKLQDIIRLTRDAKILFPLIKKIFMELKRAGWDESSWKSKAGMGAAIWASLIIGKAAAGIALLGGAIAVPLWIVFGTGDKFVKALIAELKKRMPAL